MDNTMSIEEFNSLKVGDRVLCKYGSKATVMEVGVKDSQMRGMMVILKVDVRKFACPAFFRSELVRKINDKPTCKDIDDRYTFSGEIKASYVYDETFDL